MDHRLFHIHLHDNDRTGDHHWSIGRGTIEFEPFYAEIMRRVPEVTLSLEVQDKMEVQMGDLRELAAYLASKQCSTGVSS
jgi:sugar phosphate isomerase/epimerase